MNSGSRDRKATELEHEPLKNRITTDHSNLKDKSDKFVETKQDVHAHGEISHPNANQTQINSSNVNTTVDSKDKVSTLVQKLRFTTAKSVKEEKEMEVVTQVQEAPCDYQISVHA